MDEFMVLVCFGFILCGFLLGAPIGWVLGQRDAYGRLCDDVITDDEYGAISDHILNYDEARLGHEESWVPDSPEVHQ